MSKGPWTEPRGNLCPRDSEKKHPNRNLRRSLQGGGKKTAECDVTEVKRRGVWAVEVSAPEVKEEECSRYCTVECFRDLNEHGVSGGVKVESSCSGLNSEWRGGEERVGERW